MDVVVLEQCEKEIRKFPIEIREKLADAIARLQSGLVLSMPLSRSMPSVGSNVHEFRFKDSSGQFRIIYLVRAKDAIYLVHAFKKKTQSTLKKNIDLAKRRIKSI